MHKVMHFGSHNRQFTYHMKGKQLEEVNSEKDLGVIISSNLKVADHCRHAYVFFFTILGCSEHFKCKSCDEMAGKTKASRI